MSLFEFTATQHSLLWRSNLVDYPKIDIENSRRYCEGPHLEDEAHESRARGTERVNAAAVGARSPNTQSWNRQTTFSTLE
jgi:hypothetical protein